MLPIGRVACPRTEAIDDDWGELVSRVILDGEHFTAESVQGLGEFSHLDVVYVFDQVDPDSYEIGARRPRGNPE
jgi:tRNA (Thr-GGU) A37 N-methylase